MNPGQTVSEIGEQELISQLAPWVLCFTNKDGVMGIGDDCALLPDVLKSGQRVVTTDLLIEGTHFLRDNSTDWSAIGHKAAVANLSDLASMGCEATALLVSIALPLDLPVKDVLLLYQGIHKITSQFSAPIIGGDTTRSTHVVISITAIGWKSVDWASCLRSDARPGDNIYVTGDLGSSRAGLELLLDSSRFQQALSADEVENLIHKHFYRTPRIEAGLCLARNFKRVAMIDISDGLFNESGLIAKASNVLMSIDMDKIPVSPDTLKISDILNVTPQKFAMFSGEEYELLFTTDASIDDIRDKFTQACVTCPVTQVGTVNPGNGVKLLSGGHPVDTTDETFKHF